MTNINYKIGSLYVQEHVFTVPLNHFEPTKEKIKIFAREVRSLECLGSESFPILFHFNGGPGYENHRQLDMGGWLGRALKQFRVVLMDQRGTGRSSPLNHQTLSHKRDPQDKAHYLKWFRADSIVKDAERIREHFLGDQPWTVLGQSYGGFCICTYLSFAPQGLERALIAGGLPPIGQRPEDIYRHTYKTLLNKNDKFYNRYPFFKEICNKISEHLKSKEFFFPNGDPFTRERFQQLGIVLGMGNGKERLFKILENALIETYYGESLSNDFIRLVESQCWFTPHPLYAVLHESIYCEGSASNWAAHRVLKEFKEFSPSETSFNFTGEMVYPWMFDQIGSLKSFQETAEILANDTDWPALYDVTTLSKNTVPCAALLYAEDMYVSRAFSEETAKKIKGLQVWMTNEFDHDGLYYGEFNKNPLNRLLELTGVF